MSILGLNEDMEMLEEYLEVGLDEDDGEYIDFPTFPGNKKRKTMKPYKKPNGEACVYPIKKKDREFENKMKVAEEVSKYEHVFDITSPLFCDKQLQRSTWNKISVALSLPVEKCVEYWNSLKRSAKYYANEQKVAFKSGASANELSAQTYRADWPFRDVMAFYAPPSLREASDSIVLSNYRSNPASPNALAASLPSTSSSDATDPIFFGGDTCYDQTPAPKGRLKKDQLAESVSLMAKSFSSYLDDKSTQKYQPMETSSKPLKYIEMWSNFDRLVSKLDEDTVDDLNIQITNLIGAALKKKRELS